MNDKTKTILSHIACALGGMALGIALLGGLSYCSTAKKATSESVNTILTKKNAVITTDGGYIGYQFTLHPLTYSVSSGNYAYAWYSVDTSTYTLAQTSTGTGTNAIYYATNIRSAVEGLYNSQSVSQNEVYFLQVEGYTSSLFYGDTPNYWSYYSFLLGANYANQALTFIMTAHEAGLRGLSLYANKISYNNSSTLPYFINYQRSDTILYSGASPEQKTFQDVASYYKETGYQNGYDEGEATGYNQGLTEGLEYGQEFTTYQVMTQDNNGGTRWPSYGWTINTNAPSGMYGAQSSSTYQIANLLQYKTQDDDLHLVYLMLPIEDNDYFNHVYIYVYNQTDSVLEDTIAYGLRYYQTIADEKGWDYAYMFWTSGGTRTLDYGKVTAIYNDSLQKGYIQLSGLVYQETIYNTGYQAGLLAGQTSSNMNNVFSLFTTAFNAVGGFFELQVFGFLPLYWFFLAPLFVALIALILRMVKH